MLALDGQALALAALSGGQPTGSSGSMDSHGSKYAKEPDRTHKMVACPFLQAHEAVIGLVSRLLPWRVSDASPHV